VRRRGIVGRGARPAERRRSCGATGEEPAMSCRTLALLFPVLVLSACGRERPAVMALESVNPVAPLPKMPLGIDGKVKWEEVAGEFKVTPERVRLGRWLFFDPRLSADGTISCATCHRPEHAFSEPTPVSTGIKGQKGSRKAPPIANAAWPIYPVYFWDGRADSLVAQAKGPMENPIEMGNTHAAITTAIGAIAGYRPYFKEAFGDDKVTIDRIAEAIAAYEATCLSGNSRFDRFVKGDKSALSAEEQKGKELFEGRATCVECHLGMNLTDSKFHNLGVGWNEKDKKFADDGRAKISKDPAELGAFKTPGLRDVTKHAPYMHDGSLATLKECVEHYNQGGIKNPTLDPKMKKLDLKPDEVDAIVAFMKSFDGAGPVEKAPATFPK
jgi:cytochrome c peroxidase